MDDASKGIPLSLIEQAMVFQQLAKDHEQADGALCERVRL